MPRRTPCLSRKYILPRVSEVPAAARDEVMVAALRDLPVLAAEDPSLFYHMRTTAWVPTPGGQLRMPVALLHPQCAPHPATCHPDAAFALPGSCYAVKWCALILQHP